MESRLAGEEPLPLPAWLAEMLAPQFRCVGAWHHDGGIRVDLLDDAGARKDVLIDNPVDTQGDWPLTTPWFAISVPSAALGSEHCQVIAELLSADGARVGRLLRLVRSLVQTGGEDDRPLASNAWWAGLLVGCAHASDEAIDPEVARCAIESARAVSHPSERAVGVHVLVAMGLYTEALTLWTTLPKEQCDATPELAHLHALVLALLGRDEEAVAWIEVLERITPDSEPYRQACAHFWRLHGCAKREIDHLAWLMSLPTANPSPDDWIELARAHAAIGGATRAIDILLEAPARLHSDAVFVLKAFGHLIDADRDDIAEQWLMLASERDPTNHDLAVAAATLALWRTETAQAVALVQDHAAHDPRGLRILGAAAALAGRNGTALRWLDQFIAQCPDDVEAALWRAEVYLRDGAIGRARAEIGRTVTRANAYPVTQLLRLLARRWYPRYVTVASNLADGFVHEELAAICGVTEVDNGLQSASALRAVLWTALERLGGNRSARLTLLRPSAATGERGRLTRLHTLSARAAATQNLARLSAANVDEVLATFDTLARQYPHSPHPYTYRGELLLWLGEYRQALWAFEEAHHRRPCRWDYVGRGAAWMMLGKPLRAMLLLQAGVARFGNLSGATTPVYRGEILRAAGFTRAAMRDLSDAVAAKAGRVGAWMNLALAQARLDQPAAAQSIRTRLINEAPAILWESMGGAQAGRSCGSEEEEVQQVFARTLHLMRGNRSSTVHTMVTADGKLRVLPPAAEWRAYARRTLAIPRLILETHAYASI